MNDAESTPSPNRFCNMFGMRSAALNTPAASELPRKCANAFSRTSPEMRLSRMPAATSAAKLPLRFGAAGATAGAAAAPSMFVSSEFMRDAARYHTAPAAAAADYRMKTIRIAGAGPSGLAAAIALARAGRTVEVHEAKRDVGSRFI